MALHPVIILPKLVVIIIIVVVLIVLHAVLSPEQFRLALGISVLVFVVFVGVFWAVVSRILRNPNARLSKMIVLFDEQRATEGFRAASDEFEGLVGQRGKTVSALRPAGVVLIGEKRVPVVTEGDFIPAGSDVEVVSVKGSRVVVRRVKG